MLRVYTHRIYTLGKDARVYIAYTIGKYARGVHRIYSIGKYHSRYIYTAYIHSFDFLVDFLVVQKVWVSYLSEKKEE